MTLSVSGIAYSSVTCWAAMSKLLSDQLIWISAKQTHCLACVCIAFCPLLKASTISSQWWSRYSFCFACDEHAFCDESTLSTTIQIKCSTPHIRVTEPQPSRAQTDTEWIPFTSMYTLFEWCIVAIPTLARISIDAIDGYLFGGGFANLVSCSFPIAAQQPCPWPTHSPHASRTHMFWHQFLFTIIIV